MNWKQILHQLDKTEERVIFVLMSAALAILFIQVFSRYVLAYSFAWAEQLVRIFFVWVTFMGISLASKHSMHICIDVTQLFLPDSVTRIINIVAGLFTIFLSIVLAWLISRIMAAQVEHPQYFSSIPWLPAWSMYLAGVLGMLGLAIRTAIYGVWPLIKNISSPGADKPAADDEVI